MFDIGPTVTVIIGENARGKTNLLEAIYFLINGVGFRESKEEELIQMGEGQSVVEGKFKEKKSHFDYKIHVIKKEAVIEKSYFIQKTKKRHAQYLQDQTKAILFAPEQIDIITGPPDMRRSYLNKRISQYDLEYKKKVANLESAIRRRNKIFEFVRDEQKLESQLVFWNNYIIEQSTYITRKREEYITYLNSHPSLDHKLFGANYLKNDATIIRFKEVYVREKRIRKTLIGPQKDDFEIYLKQGFNPPSRKSSTVELRDAELISASAGFQLLQEAQKKNPRPSGRGSFNKNVAHYGSRSEQRLAVFWLKMNEIWYFEELFRKKPIILLDDIFSEFDRLNKKTILELIKKYQTVLTTTEEEIINYIGGEKTIIRV